MSHAEYTIPHLSFFSENPINYAIESNEFLEVSPINSMDSSEIVEFRCLSQPMVFKSLSEIYLKGELQILKSDSTKYTPSDTLQPTVINNSLFSLIKSVSLSLNNVQIINLNETFAQKDIIEQYINFNKQTCKDRLCIQGLFPPEKEDERKAFYTNSKIIELIGKFNILNLDKFIIPGVDVGIKLTLHNDKFIIQESSLATSSSNSKFVLKNLKLEIRHIKLRENFNIILERQLSSGIPINYDFKSGEVISYSIPSSTTSYTVPAVYLSYRPHFILTTFVKTSNFLGNKAKDGHAYEMGTLEQFAYVINGALTPKSSFVFKESESEKKYSQIFNNLFRSLDNNYENCSTLINYKNFTEKCFFISYDLTSYNFGLTSVMEPLENVNLGFSLVFSKPTIEPITILMYVLKCRRFSINGLRKVENIY